MARDGSGAYSLPEAAFVNGTTIDATAVTEAYDTARSLWIAERDTIVAKLTAYLPALNANSYTPQGVEQAAASGGGGGEGMDDHDWDGAEQLTEGEKEALARDVDQALRQGKILAGKMSGNVPREVVDALYNAARKAVEKYGAQITDSLNVFGAETKLLGPDEYAQYLKSQQQIFGAEIKTMAP